jgi:hypothetical protein
MNEQARREDHPVWTVYDKLRTARLNVKYYGCRLQSTERLNFSIELLILVAAPTSAVAGLWFWNTEYGKVIWQYMGVLAAIAAVVKPLLGLTKRIKDYENILSGYRMLDFDLMDIKRSIERKRKFDAALQTEFDKAIQRERQLIGKNPENLEKKRVLLRCQNEVLQELPPESFFIPAS